MRLAKALADLNKPEAGLRKLMGALLTPAWLVSPDGATTFHNAAWRQLVGAEAAEAGSWLAHTPPKERTVCADAFARIKASMAADVITTSLRDADGQDRRVLIEIGPAHA